MLLERRSFVENKTTWVDTKREEAIPLTSDIPHFIGYKLISHS